MMIRLTGRCGVTDKPDGVLCLSFEVRQKARSLVKSAAGEEVGIFIERGTSLKHWDHLRADDGRVFRIEAEAEEVAVVHCSLAMDLARAAYHLGNRHVRLQVGSDWVAFEPDHVLEHMIEDLGFEVSHRRQEFEPERGAYHRHGKEDSHPTAEHLHRPDAAPHR